MHKVLTPFLLALVLTIDTVSVAHGYASPPSPPPVSNPEPKPEPQPEPAPVPTTPPEPIGPCFPRPICTM